MVGDSGCVITTWDGLVHCGMSGIGLVHSGLGGVSSRTGGFIGNGCLSIRSGGVALGNMGNSLVVGFRLNDMTSGVLKEG